MAMTLVTMPTPGSAVICQLSEFSLTFLSFYQRRYNTPTHSTLITHPHTQINNRYLHLGQNKRKQLTELLSASSSQVVGVLCACLGSCGENEEIATRMFACLGSWAQLRGFSEDMLAGGGLLAALFNTLVRL